MPYESISFAAWARYFVVNFKEEGGGGGGHFKFEQADRWRASRPVNKISRVLIIIPRPRWAIGHDITRLQDGSKELDLE